MKKTVLFASFLFFNLCFAQIGGLVDMEDPHKESYDELREHKENIYLTCKYSHEFGQIKDGSSSKIKPMKKEKVQDRFNELRSVWNGRSYRTNDDYSGNTTRRIKFGRVDVDFFIISKERSSVYERYAGAGGSATGDSQRWIYQSKENLLWAPEGSSFDEQIIFPRGKRSFLAHDALRADYSYNYEGLTVNMPFFLRSWSFDEGFFYFRHYKQPSAMPHERLVLDRTDLSLQAQYVEFENCNYLKGYLTGDADCDKSTLVLVSQCEIVSPKDFEEAIKNEIVNRSNQLQNAKKVKERIERERNNKEKVIRERKI